MSWLQSIHHVVNRRGFPCLKDSSQVMAQNIIDGPWEGTKGP